MSRGAPIGCLILLAIVVELLLLGCKHTATEPPKPAPTEVVLRAWITYEVDGKEYRIDADSVTIHIERYVDRARVMRWLELTEGMP